MPGSKSIPLPAPRPVPGWRVRVTIGLVLFAAVLALPLPALWSSRVALAYTLAAVGHCVLIFSVMRRPRREEMQAFVRHDETPSWGPLLGSGIVAVGSLAILIYLQRSVADRPPGVKELQVGLSTLGVLAGWVTLHTSFAIHYAGLYYAPAPGEPERPAAGLTFPDPDLIPDYWDFLYYSFVIGMCFQTSDVSVVRADIRRYTLLHSIFAYLYAVGLLSWLLGAMNSAF